ncbi:MAG: TetR/AcrR family transcriptional regulator [Actinomycetota bacterium]
MVATSPGFDRPTEDLTTRARIRDAAMSEFAEKGYRGASMRGIAAAAGVSLGLVQHHFGTKDGLRAACDEAVLALIKFKTEAMDEGRIGDPSVFSSMLAVAPGVQRYVGRALVDGSAPIAGMVEEVMARSEEFLTSWWPQRFPAGDTRTRDAAAVLTAINTSTMILQPHVARRIGVEPWTETAIIRIGQAMLDAFEAISDMVDTDVWRDIRAAVDEYQKKDEV